LNSPIVSEKANSDEYGSGKVFITNVDGAMEQNPEKEYIELIASRSNKQDVNISGWKLRNSKGEEFVIGRGVKVFYSGVLNEKNDIILSPGDRVVLSSGESPVGLSFAVNKCSGYLEQFQDFNPGLTKRCPNPADDFSSANMNEACKAYLSTLALCEVYAGERPQGLDSACINYLNNEINYNSCVDKHRTDADFYNKEWRIFLRKQKELWANNGDLIRLYNSEGSLLDSARY